MTVYKDKKTAFIHSREDKYPFQEWEILKDEDIARKYGKLTRRRN